MKPPPQPADTLGQGLVIHHGPTTTISAAYQELARWAETTGRATADYIWREHYLEADSEDQTNWIVEVQLELN